MTLDVEMHSSVIVVGVTNQARGGFTITSDKNTAFGGYKDGFLFVGTNLLDAGVRFHSYFPSFAVGKKTLRFHTFAYGTAPPAVEPTDRQPELEFVVEAVGYETRYVTLKDKDTEEEVECFITFVKKDSPHLYNTITVPSGLPVLSKTATIPRSATEWIMLVEKRIDDKTMYYENIDPATIPDGFSTILMKKKSEDLIRMTATVKWDGIRELFEKILLYIDPLYWAFRCISDVAPQYAVWLFNLLFTVDMPAFIRADLVAVRCVDLAGEKFEFDIRITPNSVKGWVVTLAKQLAKWGARLLFASLLMAGAYLIISKIESIVRAPADIVKDITDMTTTLTIQSHEIQDKIMADPTLTSEQKIKAIETEKTYTTNVIRTSTQTASEITAPFPWGTAIVIIAVVIVVGFIIAVIRG